jgi:hypothetical protein
MRVQCCAKSVVKTSICVCSVSYRGGGEPAARPVGCRHTINKISSSARVGARRRLLRRLKERVALETNLARPNTVSTMCCGTGARGWSCYEETPPRQRFSFALVLVAKPWRVRVLSRAPSSRMKWDSFISGRSKAHRRHHPPSAACSRARKMGLFTSSS